MPITLDKPTLPDNKIFHMTIKRENSGIKLFIQSPKLEKFFQSIQVAEGEFHSSNKSGWRDFKGYKIKPLKSGLNDYFNFWGQSEFMKNGMPNLSFFLVRGLSEGVTFEIALDAPMAAETLEKWNEQCKKQLALIFKEYIKEVQLTLSISIAEID